MTPTELNRLIAPCFEKHPETRPQCLRWCGSFFLDEEGRDALNELELDVDTAIQLCESSLSRFTNCGTAPWSMAEPKKFMAFQQGCLENPDGNSWGPFDSRLEALIAAAMSLPSLTIEQKG